MNLHRRVTDCDLSQRAAERGMRDTEAAFYLRTHRVLPVVAHAAVIDMASHQRAGREHANVIAWREQAPQCRGVSCRQGRMPCRERCGALAEMACAEPEPDMPSLWCRLLAWLKSPSAF